LDESQEIINDLVVECTEQLDDIVGDVLNLEEKTDTETVNKIFRVFHSIKGNISMMGFLNCSGFAHKAEDIVSFIRDGKLTPDSEIVDVLLKSLDTLKTLLGDIRDKGTDNRNVSEVVKLLRRIDPSHSTHSLKNRSMADLAEEARKKTTSSTPRESKKASVKMRLKILLVEDNFSDRYLIQKMLASHGEVIIAVNGIEAVRAFQEALDQNEPYDLICLDIMMPEKDGITALREIRQIEKSNNILVGRGVKIIMTTSLGSPKQVMRAFDEMCNGYLVKPIMKSQLDQLLKKFNLVT